MYKIANSTENCVYQIIDCLDLQTNLDTSNTLNVQNYENSMEIVYIRFIDCLDLRKNLDTLYMLIVQIVKFEGQLCTLDVQIFYI